ncbi:Homeobox protein onecut [Eufriesea mexicana]|nr:Homeobox protein onecut [Eufriesea mexicana]
MITRIGSMDIPTSKSSAVSSLSLEGLLDRVATRRYSSAEQEFVFIERTREKPLTSLALSSDMTTLPVVAGDLWEIGLNVEVFLPLNSAQFRCLTLSDPRPSRGSPAALLCSLSSEYRAQSNVVLGSLQRTMEGRELIPEIRKIAIHQKFMFVGERGRTSMRARVQRVGRGVDRGSERGAITLNFFEFIVEGTRGNEEDMDSTSEEHSMAPPTSITNETRGQWCGYRLGLGICIEEERKFGRISRGSKRENEKTSKAEKAERQHRNTRYEFPPPFCVFESVLRRHGCLAAPQSHLAGRFSGADGATRGAQNYEEQGSRERVRDLSGNGAGYTDEKKGILFDHARHRKFSLDHARSISNSARIPSIVVANDGERNKSNLATRVIHRVSPNSLVLLTPSKRFEESDGEERERGILLEGVETVSFEFRVCVTIEDLGRRSRIHDTLAKCPIIRLFYGASTERHGVGPGISIGCSPARRADEIFPRDLILFGTLVKVAGRLFTRRAQSVSRGLFSEKFAVPDHVRDFLCTLEESWTEKEWNDRGNGEDYPCLAPESGKLARRGRWKVRLILALNCSYPRGEFQLPTESIAEKREARAGPRQRQKSKGKRGDRVKNQTGPAAAQIPQRANLIPIPFLSTPIIHPVHPDPNAKETKRPSKEMQVTIARQLGLEPTTVGNFFMNARRRSMDKWKDEDPKTVAVEEGQLSPTIDNSPCHGCVSKQESSQRTPNESLIYVHGNYLTVDGSLPRSRRTSLFDTITFLLGSSDPKPGPIVPGTPGIVLFSETATFVASIRGRSGLRGTEKRGKWIGRG